MRHDEQVTVSIVLRALGLAIALWLSPAAARADYRFDTWTTADGLPQNAIRALHQTRDGYLWLATEVGLARFDGLRFTVFRKHETPGVGGSRVRAMFESTNGDLWAGTEDGGVLRYRDGRFTNFTTRDGLARDRVWPAASGGGFGLRGIARRVHFLGGTWTIRSAPGAGTTIDVVIRRPPPPAADESA